MVHGFHSITVAVLAWGYSLHAGMVVVADGSERAERRLERVLTTDPGMGVARHVDAGYDIAIQTAKEKVFIFQ